MDTHIVFDIVVLVVAVGALILAWMAYHRPAVAAHPEQAKRDLIQSAAEDGITLAEQAAKKNLANGHELGDTAKLKIAVGHFLEVARRHGFTYTETEGARVVEAAFGRRKGRGGPGGPAGALPS